MSSAPLWEPGRNAVHKLIQLCDVMAIALNRFYQLSFRLPAENDPTYMTEHQRLWDDLFVIQRAVFPTADFAPQHTVFRLATGAIAELSRNGSKDETTVGDAQTWLTNAGWATPTAYPKNPVSPLIKKFNEERTFLFQYTGGTIRPSLIAALARIGQTLPDPIHQRVAIIVNSWPAGKPDPITQEELLAMVRATEPTADNAVSPTADNSSPKTSLERNPQPMTDELRAIAERCNDLIEILSPGFVREALERIPLTREAPQQWANEGIDPPHYRQLEECWEAARRVGRKLGVVESLPALPGPQVLSHDARNFLGQLEQYCNRMAETLGSGPKGQTESARLAECDQMRLHASQNKIICMKTQPTLLNVMENGDPLPTSKVRGVISLNALRAHLEMTGFSDWRKRMESWPEVPSIRLRCAELFLGQPFSSETIELLIAWFQERGLTSDQARHLPLAEVVRRLPKNDSTPLQNKETEADKSPGDSDRSQHYSDQNTQKREHERQNEEHGAILRDLENLPERAKLAFKQHRQAVQELIEDGRSESDVTDAAAYHHLKETQVGKLPSLDTWKRNLRTARKALEQQKKKPRAKYTGRSAVPPGHFGDRGHD